MTGTALPDWVQRAIAAFLEDIRRGRYRGGQLTLNVSPQALITSVEAHGRIEGRDAPVVE